MNENVKLLLLKIIKFSGDVSPLIKLGFEYSQIAEFIAIEIADSNAEYKNGQLLLTENGNKLIEILSKNRRSGSETWIEPEIQSKIAKFDKDFIFLPSMKDLSF